MKLFVGAKALIVQNGKILVLREASYEEGTNEGKWDVPGGRINPEEPILDGLRREIMEESGLSVEIGKILGVNETFPLIKGEACHIVRIYYECKPTTNTITLSGDHDMYEWIDPKADTDMNFIGNLKEIIDRVE